MKRKSPKIRHLFELIVGIALIITINLLGNIKFGRIDMTADKIHTLSDKTKEFLAENMTSVVNVDIYLGGEYPAQLEKLKLSISEKLNEFSAYASGKIKFNFIDPYEDKALYPELEKMLHDKRLDKSYLQVNKDGSFEDLEFWPVVVMRYGNNEEVLQLLRPQAYTTVRFINHAVNNLEYYFITSFAKLAGMKRNNVSFLQGHGELSWDETWSFRGYLNQFYDADTVQITTYNEDSVLTPNLNALDKTDILVVASPKEEIPEKELFIIDQYIMNGGKVAWLMDMISIREDSLLFLNQYYGEQAFVFSNPRQFELLEDAIYKYGVNVNRDIISDKVCAPSPVLGVDQQGKPIQVKDWHLYPLVTKAESELTHNVNPIRTNYPSSLKINEGSPVNKEVILESSDRNKIYPARMRIGWNFNYDPMQFIEEDHGTVEAQPLAIYLDGKFNSYTKGRKTTPAFEKFITEGGYNYRETGDHTQMVVIGDGDIIRNDYNQYTRSYSDIEEERAYFGSAENGKMYGNATFMLNVFDKMTGNDFLIPLRSRIKIQRLLNREEISVNRQYWQSINLTIPVILVIVFGGIQFFVRKRKYAQQA